MSRRCLIFVALLAGCAARGLPIYDADPQLGVPVNLRDTGLYSDWSTLSVDPSNRPYTPAFSLWSDGAQKSRWIYLPPGTQIDVSNVDEWQFPVGTKVWKEFRADRRQDDGTVRADAHLETRLLWKRSPTQWSMVTYVWSLDETSATVAHSSAAPPVPLPGTTSYEVPVARCPVCHGGRTDYVLGFEAALLAAPEADQSGLTWQRLRDEKLVTATAPTNEALQFLAQASPTERQAVGYLHANCGVSCHNADAREMTPFAARLETSSSGQLPASIEDTSVFRDAINVPSKFTPSQGKGPWYRIRPGDETRSSLFYRMNLRNGLLGGGEQMPPIDSHAIDADGVSLMQSWIRSMTQAPYPTAAP